MTRANDVAKISVSVAGPEGDQHLLIMVANGTCCDMHQITLAEARAVSLEIIKQVGRAERRKRYNSKPTELAPVQAFSFRRQHQF